MEVLIGIILAIAVGLMLSWSGMDRERALYPTLMIVIASYYVLFAVLGNSQQSQWVESLVFLVFLGAAIAGFRSSLWLVVLALAAHGAFDLVHGLVIDNPGVPGWWPGFCAAYDVAAAIYLGCMLRRGRVAAKSLAAN